MSMTLIPGGRLTASARPGTITGVATVRAPNPARVKVLTVLLEQYTALVDPMQMRATPGDGSGVIGMPGTWTPSVRELERLLKVLRDSYHAPLVVTSAGKVSQRRLWWHLNEWYLRAETTLVRPARMPRSKGKALQRALLTEDGKPLPVRRVIRHPQASEQLARAGVEWLAASWSLSHEPMLPDELMAA